MSSGALLAFQQTQVTITCCNCGITFSVPDYWRTKRIDDHREFWCPNGHKQLFSGESEAERLRKQLAEREQQLEFERQRAATNYAAREKAEKALRGLNKRAAAGVCPCCKRAVSQMARHIKTKHPEYVEAAR